MRISGALATAVGLACAAFSRAGTFATGVWESPMAASSVAKASPPMAAQKPIPVVTSNAPVTTHEPPVNCARGRSLAPVIKRAAQIRPPMAQAAAPKRDARCGINEAISPRRAQASTEMAMGARIFSAVARLATGVGAGSTGSPDGSGLPFCL